MITPSGIGAGQASPASRISAVVQQWFLAEPLLFGAWTSHQIRPNSRLKSMRVGRGLVEYHPDFVSQLDDRSLREVMKFEALRIVLKHPYERRKPHAEWAWEASNLAIRECTPTSMPMPTAQVRFGSDEHNSKFFEYYYNLIGGSQSQPPRDDKQASPPRLKQQDTKDKGNDQDQDQDRKPKQTKKQQDKKSPKKQKRDPLDESQPCDARQNEKKSDCDGESDSTCQGNSPCDGDGDCTSDGQADGNANEQEQSNAYEWGETMPCSSAQEYCDPRLVGYQNAFHWDFDELVSRQINDLIDEIESGNTWGTIAGMARELILASRNPRLDYRRVLRAFRASVLSSDRRLTRMKPNRRYDFQYMGSRRDFTTQLLFAVDVSGSVSTDDVSNAFSIINRLFKYGVQSIDVVWFDTLIRNEEPLSLKKACRRIEVDGRGGTCFQPIMHYLDEHRDYDGLIIFTDGIAPVPEPPQRNRRTRICWLFNREENWKSYHSQLELPGMTSAFLLPD